MSAELQSRAEGLPAWGDVNALLWSTSVSPIDTHGVAQHTVHSRRASHGATPTSHDAQQLHSSAAAQKLLLSTPVRASIEGLAPMATVRAGTSAAAFGVREPLSVASSASHEGYAASFPDEGEDAHGRVHPRGVPSLAASASSSASTIHGSSSVASGAPASNRPGHAPAPAQRGEPPPAPSGPLTHVPLHLPPGTLSAVWGDESTADPAPPSLLRSLLPVTHSMDVPRVMAILSSLAVAYRQLELITVHREAEVSAARADASAAMREVHSLTDRLMEARETNGFLQHGYEQLVAACEEGGRQDGGVVHTLLALPSLRTLREQALHVAAHTIQENRREITRLAGQVEDARAALREARAWQGAGIAGVRSELERLTQHAAATGTLADARTNQAQAVMADAAKHAADADSARLQAEAAQAELQAQVAAEKAARVQLQTLLSGAHARESQSSQQLRWAEEAIAVLKQEVKLRDALLKDQMETIDRLHKQSEAAGMYYAEGVGAPVLPQSLGAQGAGQAPNGSYAPRPWVGGAGRAGSGVESTTAALLGRAASGAGGGGGSAMDRSGVYNTTADPQAILVTSLDRSMHSGSGEGRLEGEEAPRAPDYSATGHVPPSPGRASLAAQQRIAVDQALEEARAARAEADAVRQAMAAAVRAQAVVDRVMHATGSPRSGLLSTVPSRAGDSASVASAARSLAPESPARSINSLPSSARSALSVATGGSPVRHGSLTGVPSPVQPVRASASSSVDETHTGGGGGGNGSGSPPRVHTLRGGGGPSLAASVHDLSVHSAPVPAASAPLATGPRPRMPVRLSGPVLDSIELLGHSLPSGHVPRRGLSGPVRTEGEGLSLRQDEGGGYAEEEEEGEGAYEVPRDGGFAASGALTHVDHSSGPHFAADARRREGGEGRARSVESRLNKSGSATLLSLPSRVPSVVDAGSGGKALPASAPAPLPVWRAEGSPKRAAPACPTTHAPLDPLSAGAGIGTPSRQPDPRAPTSSVGTRMPTELWEFLQEEVDRF